MFSSKVKALIIVFVLLLSTGLFAVGCKKKASHEWVNTNSLPGKTFSKYLKSDAQGSTSGIVYLGDDKNAPNVDFGPRDVSFNFRDLK